MTATISGHKRTFKERNSVKPTDSNQPRWALGGNVDTKKSSETKNFWRQKKGKEKRTEELP